MHSDEDWKVNEFFIKRYIYNFRKAILWCFLLYLIDRGCFLGGDFKIYQTYLTYVEENGNYIWDIIIQNSQ